MHLRTRTWFLISVGCFLAAWFFWQLAGRLERDRNAKTTREEAAPAASNSGGNAPPPSPAAGSANATNLPAVNSTPASPAPASAVRTNTAVRKEPFPYRLSNTPRTVDDLGRSDAAVLLRNALIDSSAPVNLALPPHLRAVGDPGAYVVQARGPLTDGFRALLGRAGAQIISYVPNNAYLVRANARVAQQLAALPETQTVLPWEPYYKLDSKLLELAVERKPLPADAKLNVVVFANAGDAVRQALAQAGMEILGEDRTPFGPMLAVKPSADALPMLAALPGVQAIERLLPRKPVNDLSRSRLKASANVGPSGEAGSENYRGLTGVGVKVNVNDTGVDASHPDLAGRVTGDSPFTIQDFDGHGTHVAGIIASSGVSGPNGENVQGSFENSNYRGMAPEADIFAMPIDLNFGPFQSESYLQETAAAAGANVSNNSWGYPGAPDYTFASASWDAATRDALPGVTGSQPLTLVFAAGNSGFASDVGIGGIPGSILAPGTGKNVITVGAVESYRNVTNSFIEVVDDNGTMVTNVLQPFLGNSDSSNQVVSFSSRGNVGAGIEGDAGRFKPDVVAPGALIASLRSRQAALPDSLTNVLVNNVFDQTLQRGQANLYAVFVPNDGFRLVIQVLTNRASPSPMPPLTIRVQQGSPPTAASRSFVNNADLGVAPGIYFYSIENNSQVDVSFDIRTYVVIRVEPPTGYFEVLKELNDSLAPNYRFESGTSQAAPAVTGLIALMQEFFNTDFGRTNSPALTKALLINGARTLSDEYDFQINPTVNAQGWGLVNLTNSIPEGDRSVVSGESPEVTGRVIFLDQSPSRALGTGQSITREIVVPLLAGDFPLRVTLAWTDPPGNPAVGIKLVNDLDLIVTNLVTGEIFEGNHFPNAATFTSGTATNGVPIPDFINNVENVFLNRGLSGRYSVTVRARRVNVNAVTDHPSGIVQDFALVISTDRPTGGLTVRTPVPAFTLAPLVTFVTNGAALLNQRVGANSPLIVSTNGASNQWHFFVVTNQLPPSDPLYSSGGGSPTYMAFTTFLPPNLSRPRSSEEADIDLYVSDDPAITNLNTGVINAAFKSRRRGGTESIVISNAVPNRLYYAGVKSEDQQAANFGFFSISSVLPFSSEDAEGNVTAIGYPRVIDIPDGTPRRPEAALVFAFVTQPITIEGVVVTNSLSHDSGGDLLGNLSHDNGFAVLNDHRPFQGNNLTWIYDDSDSGDVPASQPVDGPGSLNSFVGQEGLGVWQLAMIDNSRFHTGRVDFLSIKLAPQLEDLFNNNGVNGRILPRRFASRIFSVDVPAEATNLSVCVKPVGGPVEVYIRREAIPTLTQYDMFGAVGEEGGCVTLGRGDSPPLSAGRYFIRLFNPNFNEITYNVRIQVDLDLNRRDAFTFRSGGAQPILDDAVTTSTVHVNQSRLIAEMSVGVRIDHPRVSDLVMHLVSPSGERVLLAENRGGPNGADYGSGALQTNTFPLQTSGGAAANTNVLVVADPFGTVQIDYQFFSVGDTLRIYYEDNLLFDSRLTSGGGTFAVDYGPGVSTDITIVVNEGNNPNGSTLWRYTATVLSGYNFATFTENTNQARLPIKFAPPPFAGANYFTTNYLTNAPILSDGFDTGPGTCPAIAPMIFSGWLVTTGDVDVVQPGCGFVGPQAHSQPNALDINGFTAGAVATNLITVPGNQYLLSFAYTRNPYGFAPSTAGPRSARVIWSSNQFLDITADPPNSWTNLMWQTTSVVFTATSPTSRVDLVSLNSGDGGIFFDTVEVKQISSNTEEGLYYLPEESMKPLFGENAFGDWKLEVWDNRAGAVASNGVLLAWKLNITFVNTNPAAIALTNGFAYCGQLGTNETAFFLVNVPANVKSATNTVFAGNNVSLSFNHYGLPFGQVPPDTVFLNNVNSGLGIIATNGWQSFDLSRTVQYGSNSSPVLLPGRRYYLAVQNEAPGSNSFCIQLDLALPTLAIPLADGVPFCGPLSLTLSNGILGSQVFSFEVSTNAVQATFQAYNTSGNVDLFVQHGGTFTNLPALLSLSTNYPYSSTNLGRQPEIIRVSANSRPVALTNGTWYAAVLNREMTNVSYCVVAKQALASNIVRLTNAISYVRTNGGGGIGALVPVDYFVLSVSNQPRRAQWEIFQPSGDVTLLLKKDLPLPDLLEPGLISARGGLSDELIYLFDYSTNIALTNGDWYLGVVNATGNELSYTALATEFPVYGTNFNFSASQVITGSLCLTWTNTLTNVNYHVLGADSVTPPYWVPMPPGARAFTNELTWCTPAPPPFSVFLLTEGLVPTLYPAVLNLDGTPAPPNGFTVRWSAPTDQSFLLEGSELLTPGSWQTLTNNFGSTNGLFEYFDGPQNNGVRPYRFYRFLQLP